MLENILKYIREKVRYRQYIMTLHAEEEMNNDYLTIYDIESCLLTGKIIERQKDKVTAEWKYKIKGQVFNGNEVEVIVKLSITGKLVIITVYLL
ncbi:DUF4258 domain-containing protein [Candidatus Poribacteria bacterium]|nr:DUF4258 domain-containing protein [Candidatus Poribacteria bacterium]